MKKILSLLLAVLMVVSALPVAYATETADHAEGTVVSYTADNIESWTVTVPAKLAPSGSGTVTLQGTWPSNKQITVTAQNNVVLTNTDKASDQKSLTVSFDGISELGSDTASQKFTETVSVAAMPADALFGTWTGHFYYTVGTDTQESAVVGSATFDDGVTLSWEELKLEENGTTYDYDASMISDTEIGDFAFFTDFDGCLSLTSITIPDSVTSIGAAAFMQCYALESVTIPDSVTSIGDAAFCACESLESITIPDSVTSIGEQAFVLCYALESVTIPDSVTSIGAGAFTGCESLTSINVDTSNTSYCSVNGVVYTKDMQTLVCYPSGKTEISFVIPDSVTSIEERAFMECKSLESINIPDSVTSIGVQAFNSCESLESINIPDGVTSIGEQAFMDCYALTSINIPDSVTSIGISAFMECESLESINIPDSVTSIEERAFIGCESLTSITIPDSVTSIGESAFTNCYALTSITFEGTVEQWNEITLGITWNNYVPATEVICSDGTVALS